MLLIVMTDIVTTTTFPAESQTCAGLRLAENHPARASFWWWALTLRWIVMHKGEVFHSHMPNISRSRRMHSGHVLSKCHFYYRPGWLRKTARTQPTASHFSSIFHYTHWHLMAWCWRGLKNQFTSIFLFFMNYFSFSSLAFHIEA